MTNFSTNQVMHFYVTASTAVEVLPYYNEKAFKLYFQDLDVTSDKIENVEWATFTPAISPKIKQATISFDGDAIVGQDYVVRVSYPEVGGLGVEGWTTKTAVVHAGKGATKATIIEDLKGKLEDIFEVDGVLTTKNSTSDSIVITPNLLNIKYEVGVRPFVIPDFTVTVNQVIEDGEYTDWVSLDKWNQVPVKSVPSGLANGYKLADMEYFAMGERGDEYRMAAYPNHIKYDYKITPTNNYSVYNIHCSYKGSNTDSHKSEKDIIIAISNSQLGDATCGAIESALTTIGVTVKK